MACFGPGVRFLPQAAQRSRVQRFRRNPLWCSYNFPCQKKSHEKSLPLVVVMLTFIDGYPFAVKDSTLIPSGICWTSGVCPKRFISWFAKTLLASLSDYIGFAFRKLKASSQISHVLFITKESDFPASILVPAFTCAPSVVNSEPLTFVDHILFCLHEI